MLLKFKVSNFKQFTQLELDFSKTREYAFSSDCIAELNQNKIVKNALIYGKNASGKTNLGYAIFDITQHLVDVMTDPSAYQYYLNADAPQTPASFEYDFLLGGHFIHYAYSKMTSRLVVDEELTIDGEQIFLWNMRSKQLNTSGFKSLGLTSLNWTYKDASISLLRYITNNTPLKKDSPLRLLINFVKGMLWFRRVDTNNSFIGFMAVSEQIDSFIIKEKLVTKYEKFLKENGVAEKVIAAQNVTGEQALFFKHTNPLPLFQASSSGTIALTLQFYWLEKMKQVSFVFMDEFDAFYHFESAETMLKKVKKFRHLQSVCTTHNTLLLSNAITRPDCCFKLENRRIRSFADSTEREIREGNNLGKLYIGGEFNDPS